MSLSSITTIRLNSCRQGKLCLLSYSLDDGNGIDERHRCSVT